MSNEAGTPNTPKILSVQDRLGAISTILLPVYANKLLEDHFQETEDDTFLNRLDR